MEPSAWQGGEESMQEPVDNDADAILGNSSAISENSQVSDRLRFYQTQLDGDSSDDEENEQRIRASNEEKVPYVSFSDENGDMLNQNDENDGFINNDEIRNEYAQLNDAVDDDFGEFQGFVSDHLDRNVDDIIRIHLNTVDDGNRGESSMFGSMVVEAKDEEVPANAVSNNCSWATFDAPAIAPLSADKIAMIRGIMGNFRLPPPSVGTAALADSVVRAKFRIGDEVAK